VKIEKVVSTKMPPELPRGPTGHAPLSRAIRKNKVPITSPPPAELEISYVVHESASFYVVWVTQIPFVSC
jgi:hypothetical protein